MEINIGIIIMLYKMTCFDGQTLKGLSNYEREVVEVINESKKGVYIKKGNLYIFDSNYKSKK